MVFELNEHGDDGREKVRWHEMSRTDLERRPQHKVGACVAIAAVIQLPTRSGASIRTEKWQCEAKQPIDSIQSNWQIIASRMKRYANESPCKPEMHFSASRLASLAHQLNQ